MNARGEVRKIYEKDHESVAIQADLGSCYTNWVKFTDLPFYGLTPVKRRNVEQVVTLPPLSLSKTPTNIVIVLDDGKQISVTVEVVQGEK